MSPPIDDSDYIYEKYRQEEIDAEADAIRHNQEQQNLPEVLPKDMDRGGIPSSSPRT